jgi:hypothetical protein
MARLVLANTRIIYKSFIMSFPKWGILVGSKKESSPLEILSHSDTQVLQGLGTRFLRPSRTWASKISSDSRKETLPLPSKEAGSEMKQQQTHSD